MKIKDLKKVYFIGIGGIGMSAVARYFHSLKIEIFGYDKTKTSLTENLTKQGMRIHYKEDLNLIPEDIDMVVYTPAIPANHIELKHLLTTQIPVLKRAEVLGRISKEKKTIAVAGTHGKTSTSSILSHLLKTGGVDCTSFLGGIANNYKSNYLEGCGEWIVVEADEYDRSFLHLSPDIAVITSTDADHLDIYGDHESMKHSGFFAFAKKISKDGHLLLHSKVEMDLKGLSSLNIERYGIENGNHQASEIKVHEGMFEFDYTSNDKQLKRLRFTLPGKHNIENATVAISIALKLGVSDASIREGLLSFKGIKRRFDIAFNKNGAALIDDYAHHPTELNAAINAARQLFPNKKICGVFQPHLFSRTKDFADEFAESLDQLDEVILLPIYPAREEPIEGIDSRFLLNKMKSKNKNLVEKNKLLRKLNELEFEVLMILGAGDIDVLVEPTKAFMKMKFDR